MRMHKSWWRRQHGRSSPIPSPPTARLATSPNSRAPTQQKAKDPYPLLLVPSEAAGWELLLHVA